MELRKYWEVFWRRRRLFASVIGGMALVTLIWAFSSKPVYKATSKVMIRVQDTNTNIISAVPSSVGKLNYLTSSDGIATIQAMIENSESLKKVIEGLKLKKKNGTPYSTIEILGPNFIKLISGKIGIKVEQTEDAEVFEIRGYSTNPELAAKMANELTSNFLKFSDDLNKKEIKAAIEILAKETAKLKTMIEASEELIKEYQFSNMAINLDDKASSLASQLVTMELALAKLIVEKKEGHPDIQTALSQLAYIKKDLKDITGKSIQLTRLQRINTAMVNVYTALLSDLEKAKMLMTISITNATVIEKAEIPDIHKKYYIYFPKKKIMLLLSLILGTLFGTIIVFFAEYIDDTIKKPHELKTWTGQKVLAAVPRVSKDEGLFPPKESIIPVFEAIGDLGLSIRMASQAKGDKKMPQMLTVTSYGNGEGKSLISANLGLLMSNAGRKTLLVDFNMKRPFLSNLYARPHEKGLTDFIAAGGKQEDGAAFIFKPLKDNFYFLPTGSTSESNSTYVINSPYLNDLLKTAKSEFDVVIFDAAPLNKGVGSVFIAKESDATILVIEAGRYQLEDIRWAIDELKEANANLVGAVLNKFEGKC